MRVERLDWRRFKVDTARFQQRGRAHAENIARTIEQRGWREEKAQLFHLWTDSRRRLWVLDGHSRLAGLTRLPRDRQPRRVLCAVHDQLDEAGAIKLSQELNASGVPFTKCEMARIIIAEREQLSGMGEQEAYEVLAQRFPRYNAHQLMLLAPLAYLPAELARLVDDETMPQLAGTALGRFIRDTGLDAETVTRIGLEFIRSGASVHALLRFLNQAGSNIERVEQSDMFGSSVVTRLADIEKLRKERQHLHEVRRMIAMRREVLLALEDTPARPTVAQRALLQEDELQDAAIAQQLEELEQRIRTVVQFNGKG